MFSHVSLSKEMMTQQAGRDSHVKGAGNNLIGMQLYASVVGLHLFVLEPVNQSQKSIVYNDAKHAARFPHKDARICQCAQCVTLDSSDINVS